MSVGSIKLLWSGASWFEGLVSRDAFGGQLEAIAEVVQTQLVCLPYAEAIVDRIPGLGLVLCYPKATCSSRQDDEDEDRLDTLDDRIRLITRMRNRYIVRASLLQITSPGSN